MSRETEIAAYLRQDADLLALAPGGVYAEGDLTTAGISDAALTPDVWVGSVFNTTLIVKQGKPVPSGLLTDYKTQAIHINQRVGFWAYATTLEALEGLLNMVYALVMGRQFSGAWQAQPVAGGSPFLQCPELPDGIYQMSEEYLVGAIRRPVLA